MQASTMTNEEILNRIDEMSKTERFLDLNSGLTRKSEIISFNVDDFTVWIHLGEGYSIPDCPEKRLVDYQAFRIRFFDPDEGDDFGSPFSQGAIYPSKDVRFQAQPWAIHFIADVRSAMVPVADFCQILRFLQKVNKLTAFL